MPQAQDLHGNMPTMSDANRYRSGRYSWDANLVAELLLAISSKGHGEGVKSDNSVDNTIISLAAELIVKQPKAMQNYLIDHMADFLARPDVLALKDTDTSRILRQQVEAMRNNPWAQASGKVRLAEPTPSTETPVWQAKMVTREAGEPSWQLSS